MKTQKIAIIVDDTEPLELEVKSIDIALHKFEGYDVTILIHTLKEKETFIAEGVGKPSNVGIMVTKQVDEILLSDKFFDLILLRSEKNIGMEADNLKKIDPADTVIETRLIDMNEEASIKKAAEEMVALEKEYVENNLLVQIMEPKIVFSPVEAYKFKIVEVVNKAIKKPEEKNHEPEVSSPKQT